METINTSPYVGEHLIYKSLWNVKVFETKVDDISLKRWRPAKEGWLSRWMSIDAIFILFLAFTSYIRACLWS